MKGKGSAVCKETCGRDALGCDGGHFFPLQRLFRIECAVTAVGCTVVLVCLLGWRLGDTLQLSATNGTTARVTFVALINIYGPQEERWDSSHH